MSSVTIPVVEHGYYAILEVSPSATKEQIRKSYRRLALLWHPDKRPASDVEATQKFQKVRIFVSYSHPARQSDANSYPTQINNAHEVLSHESARARYDGSVSVAVDCGVKNEWSKPGPTSASAHVCFDSGYRVRW
ncbi:DnaJ domain-containing protein [Triangularia verruculosa]|uniref:DnaJ domain-containing protein n=1 Tax=Triangularia verruculosa TaxID=2587418 RepID=A0AAN6XEP9_9PEZI|nr:DnaJ domain-containing protein [Triangularia verruculosa]